MKAFILKSLLITIPVLLLLGCLEYRARIIDHSVLHIQQEYLLKNKKQVEGLIFGPSHMWRAINPEKFDYNVASFAIAESALNVDKYIYEYTINKSHPNFLIIDLSAGYLEKLNDSFWISARRLPYYYGYFDWEHFQLKDYFLIEVPIWKNRKSFLKPEISNAYNKWGFKEKNSVKRDLFKKANYELEQIKIFENKRGVLNKHNHTIDKNYNYNVKELLLLVKETKKKGIKVIFVSPPKFYLYNAGLIQEHRDRRAAFLHKVVDNKNVYFWDYETFHEKDIHLFIDYNHLNPKGASLFTCEINKRLLEIMPNLESK